MTEFAADQEDQITMCKSQLQIMAVAFTRIIGYALIDF